MKPIAWLFKWLLKAAIFFTLFAFSLNNQGAATVVFFFGASWNAPMVLIVLSAFTFGLLVGILGMVPRWWRYRRLLARSPKGETVDARPHTATAKALPVESANGL